MVEVSRHFAKNLKRQLAKSPLSQEEVAARAGINRTQITKLQSGNHVPRIDTLIRLAGAFEVSPRELLGGLEWQPGPTSGGEFTATPKKGE